MQIAGEHCHASSLNRIKKINKKSNEVGGRLYQLKFSDGVCRATRRLTWTIIVLRGARGTEKRIRN
jgi:hypothetical protein